MFQKRLKYFTIIWKQTQLVCEEDLSNILYFWGNDWSGNSAYVQFIVNSFPHNAITKSSRFGIIELQEINRVEV